MNVPAKGGFDYAAISSEVAEAARDVAARFWESHAQTMRTILDMGRDLLAIKDQIGHGNFGPWLEAEFGAGARTAQNYMAAAERFGDKSEIVSLIAPTLVYQLSAPSTPEAARAQVIAKLEAGEALDPADVRGIIRTERREADKIAARKARSPEGRAAQSARNSRAAIRAERESAVRAEQRGVALEAAAQFLRDRLGADAAHFLDLLEAAGSFYNPAPNLRALITALPPTEGEP